MFAGQVSPVIEHKLSSPRPSSSAVVQSLDTVAGMTNGNVDSDHSSRLDTSASQPHFDRKLNNCELAGGTDVVLSCHVTGNPMPNVSQSNR